VTGAAASAPGRLRRAASATAARLRPGPLAGAYALYATALEIATGRGFIGAMVYPAGLVLLALLALACAGAAARAIRARGPLLSRAALALALAGSALLAIAIPGSLLVRRVRSLTVTEGQPLGDADLPGLPAARLARVRLAPRGPGFLSKTVEAELEVDGEGTRRIGLFPPGRLGPWSLSVFRFGYAPEVEWEDGAGRPIGAGYVPLGTFPRTEEEARLVAWAPEPNVMMGVGTFPPRLEDMLTPPGSADHLFVRLDEATLGGVRRDLRDPEAHRFALDGPPRDPVLHVEVFRGAARVFEGRLRGGEEASYPGGRIRVAPEVALWVDLLATRDPFLAAAFAGVLALALAAVAGAAVLLARLARAVPGRQAG
jgi:hypothetical protein